MSVGELLPHHMCTVVWSSSVSVGELLPHHMCTVVWSSSVTVGELQPHLMCTVVCRRGRTIRLVVVMALVLCGLTCRPNNGHMCKR